MESRLYDSVWTVRSPTAPKGKPSPLTQDRRVASTVIKGKTIVDEELGSDIVVVGKKKRELDQQRQALLIPSNSSITCQRSQVKGRLV